MNAHENRDGCWSVLNGIVMRIESRSVAKRRHEEAA